MVSILTDRNDPWTQKCGGTLVASKYVVTSASCVQNTSPASIFVMLGEHNFSKTEENQRIHDVLHIFPHEYFYASTKTHDIAVLELASPVNLTMFTPACLSKTSDGELTDGLECQVYGYGMGTRDGILHEIDVTLVDNSKCSETYEGLISRGKVCGQSQRPNSGACLVKLIDIENIDKITLG